MEEHTEDAKAEEDAARIPVSSAISFSVRILTNIVFIQVRIAVLASMFANFALCVLQR